MLKRAKIVPASGRAATVIGDTCSIDTVKFFLRGMKANDDTGRIFLNGNYSWLGFAVAALMFLQTVHNHGKTFIADLTREGRDDGSGEWLLRYPSCQGRNIEDWNTKLVLTFVGEIYLCIPCVLLTQKHRRLWLQVFTGWEMGMGLECMTGCQENRVHFSHRPSSVGKRVLHRQFLVYTITLSL
jgi:hypothetical protein